LIEVKDLVKKYGDHLAVDHLSFSVERGQVLGFLGPNGAGKSTTMNMITGYISATEGTVTINGYDIYDEPEKAKKNIGYLPEQPPVYMDMTVQEYLSFVAELKKVAKAERSKMLQDIMKRVGIDQVNNRLIKHLSKGYRQRVGLAQALVGYPELIILDEPTVGLDPMQIIEIRDLIKELAKEHTILLSSHILSEVSAICDTVMIINKGKLVVSDKPEMLSKHLKATQELEIEVKIEQEMLSDILSKLDGIEKVEYKESEEAGVTWACITMAQDTDLREELFYILANAKAPIYSMHKKAISLEEIFLELTRNKEPQSEMLNSNQKPEEEETC
jgi:ABC-2 type transport system ATP-binding protein